METGREEGPEKTGDPVYWRTRLTLQVSTTSTWVLNKLQLQTDYNGDTCYDANEMCVMQAIPTTRRRPLHYITLLCDRNYDYNGQHLPLAARESSSWSVNETSINILPARWGISTLHNGNSKLYVGILLTILMIGVMAYQITTVH